MRVIYLMLLLLSAAVSAKEEDRYAKVQIEAKAVRKLQQPSRSQDLVGFLD